MSSLHAGWSACKHFLTHTSAADVRPHLRSASRRAPGSSMAAGMSGGSVTSRALCALNGRQRSLRRASSALQQPGVHRSFVCVHVCMRVHAESSPLQPVWGPAGQARASVPKVESVLTHPQDYGFSQGGC